MRELVFFILAATLASTSITNARPSTLTMSCAEAAATVARAGAIVLTTGEHTYARFVAHNGFCLPGEEAASGAAPTMDSPSCQVGYLCKERRFDNDD